MRIINLRELSKKDYQRIITRASSSYTTLLPVVKEIMNNVKKNGDKALLEIGKKFYGENYNSLQVSNKEIKNAYKQVDKEFISSLTQMIKNITLVQKSQLQSKKEKTVNSEKGISVWREWRAIEKVGLYVPGGKAAYPSSVLMTAIPAIISGCKEIIMCTPPGRDGKIPSPTLVAADMIGLKNIYKVGGAEAIAAFTYGTETISNVYKIFGAGNAYVTLAKMEALQTVSIDMPAGPSEVFIIADETANPSFIAADLLADAEHGSDSACVLISTSQKIALDTIKEIKKQLPILNTRIRIEESLKRYGLFAVVDSLNKATEFANEYAPEHLEIMTKNSETIVKKITNAGSVFLGDWTCKASGDYATGANHILPTGKMAKMYPPLGVDAYGKWMQVQQCTKEGLLQIKNAIENIAQAEQLPAHKNSVSIRFQNNI